MMSTTINNHNHNSENGNGQLSVQNGSGKQTYQLTFSPRFDIWEGDEELILYGDLPGVDPDQFNIQFENRRLTIHGKVCRCHEGNRSVFSEYGIGDFHRTFAVGESIDTERIYAEFHDGVLTLHCPKAEGAKPRRIEVKAN